MLRRLLPLLLITSLAAEEKTRVPTAQAMGLLKTQCMGCHNAEKKKGDLSLETREAALEVIKSGKTVRLTGPRDIVNYVASNPSGHRAFIRHLFHHLVKQEPSAFGPNTLDDLQRQFAASGCHIQNLIVEIAVLAAQR